MHVEVENAPKMWLAPGLVDEVERQVTPVFVSSYGGCAPTFGVLTAEGALYADIPPSHLSKLPGQAPAKLADVVYRDCPSIDVWGGSIAALRRMETCRVYGRDRKLLCNASYVLTLDWYRDNWMSHVLLVHDGPLSGRFIVWPHFRILWGDAALALPEGFKKIRQVWRVGMV